MAVSTQPKSHHAEKPKEKRHSSGHKSQRPKTHGGVHEPHREHSRQSSHRSNVSKDGLRAGISKDGLRDGPKEITLDVAWDREPFPLSTGHTGLKSHRDGSSRHSASSAGHRPSSKHSDELRSKPVASHAPVTAQHRLSSDMRPLAGHGAGEGRLGASMKAEAKLSTKVVSLSRF